MNVFLSACLAVSGNYDFLGIGSAEPRICQQLGHSVMFVGHVSNRYSVSYKPKRNIR